MLSSLFGAAFLFLSGVLLVACDKDESGKKGSDSPLVLPLPEAERTVLAYVVGDNGRAELTYWLQKNIDDMVSGMQSVDTERYNLLVYSELVRDVPRLIYMRRNAQGTVEMDTVCSYSEQNPLDKNVMKRVFKYVTEYFPARSYGLTFLSHSSSWLPASDDANRPERSLGVYRGMDMDILDFKTALAEGFCQPLDFLFFDSCLMLSAEVACELKDNTHFIIGSPVEIPGPGAPYKSLVSYMFVKDDYAQLMAEQYYKVYEKDYLNSGALWDEGVAVGVVDCSAMDVFVKTTSEIVANHVGEFVADYSKVLRYDYSPDKSNWDLEDMMAQITGNREGAEYCEWKQAFGQVMPYWKSTPSVYSSEKHYYTGQGRFTMDTSDGLGCFVPDSSADTLLLEYYSRLKWCRDSGWLKLF